MPKRLKDILLSSGFQQSAITVGGTVLSMGISAVAMILVSRFLGPAKFGQFSVAFSLLLITAQLSDIGINFSLNKLVGQITDRAQIGKLFSQAIRIKLAIVLLVSVGGLVLSRYLANLLNLNDPSIVYGVFVLLLCTVSFDQLLYMLRSIHQFYSAVILNISQSILKIAGIGLILWVGIRSAGVTFYWYALAPGIPVLLAPIVFPKWLKLKPLTHFVAQHSQLVTLAKHMVVFLVAMTFIDNGDVLFISSYLSELETGLYAGVSRIALLLTFAAYSLGMVLNPRVARYKSKLDLSIYLKKAWWIALAAIGAFVLFVPVAKLSILVTVGPAYLAGTQYLIYLALSSFLVFATVPFIALFYSFDKLWYFSVVGLLQIIIMVVGNILLLPMMGLWGAVWVKLAIRVVTLLVTVGWGYNLYKQKSS